MSLSRASRSGRARRGSQCRCRSGRSGRRRCGGRARCTLAAVLQAPASAAPRLSAVTVADRHRSSLPEMLTAESGPERVPPAARGAEHLRARQPRLLAAVLARRRDGRAERPVLDDHVAGRALDVVVGAEPEVVVLELGRGVDQRRWSRVNRRSSSLPATTYWRSSARSARRGSGRGRSREVRRIACRRWIRSWAATAVVAATAAAAPRDSSISSREYAFSAWSWPTADTLDTCPAPSAGCAPGWACGWSPLAAALSVAVVLLLAGAALVLLTDRILRDTVQETALQRAAVVTATGRGELRGRRREERGRRHGQARRPGAGRARLTRTAPPTSTSSARRTLWSVGPMSSLMPSPGQVEVDRSEWVTYRDGIEEDDPEVTEEVLVVAYGASVKGATSSSTPPSRWSRCTTPSRPCSAWRWSGSRCWC